VVESVTLKKLTVVLEDYQIQALKGISRQKKTPQAKLIREAVDLLIAHHHFGRVEPDYMRDIDEFLAKNRDLLKSLFR
jgi:hypothetical protein